MINQVVVTDAFFAYEGELQLNPALRSYEKELLHMKQHWSDSVSYTPLSWLASQLHVPAAELVLSCAKDIPDSAKQFWLVSPYHAKLTRAELRIMPEGMLDWSKHDAQAMCALLNPLLAEEGMQLIIVADSLLLASDRVWDVAPASFAEISGSTLPNRHPAGKDGGAWMRLLAEIQMTLHQSPIISGAGLAFHGLWFWGVCTQSVNVDGDVIPAIATKNVYLKSVLKYLDKEQGASVVVTDAEQLPLLLNAHSPLPHRWILLGAGKSVKLTKSVIVSCLAKVRVQNWKG